MTHERWEKMIEWTGRKSVKFKHIRMQGMKFRQVDAIPVRMIDDTGMLVCVCVYEHVLAHTGVRTDLWTGVSYSDGFPWLPARSSLEGPISSATPFPLG